MTPLTEVEGRRLTLSNLEKVLHPVTGTTKGELLHYYATVGLAILPHLRDRPVSFLRYPDGPDGQLFFTKNPPPGTPSWMRTTPVPRSEDPRARQVVVEDLPSLMWAANLVVEFHTPQWRASSPPSPTASCSTSTPGLPRPSSSAAGSPCTCASGSRRTDSPPSPRPPAPRGCTCSSR